VSCLIVIVGVRLPEANARIVVGVSTVNVAFLPIYLTQDKGFKDKGLDALDWYFVQSLFRDSVSFCASALRAEFGVFSSRWERLEYCGW
jgi:hypothetical protein